MTEPRPRWLPDATPGLCPHGEAGPDGARACSLPDGHDGDHHLTRTATEETRR